MADYNPLDVVSDLPSYTPSPEEALRAAGGGQTQSFAPLAAIKSGLYGMARNAGGTLQAAGTALGLPGAADAGQQFAAQHQQNAEAAGRPDLESDPLSVSGLGYGLVKSLPSLAMMIGGAYLGKRAAAARGLGELGQRIGGMVGAGVAAYPTSVGENVAEATQNGQPLTQGGAAGALALGVPEAAIQSYMPQSLEHVLEQGAAGKLSQRLLTGVGINAAVGGVQSGLTTALTQFMGDPNKSTADRAHEIVQSALTGGIMGGVVGGAVHGLRPKTSPRLDPAAGADALDAASRVPGTEDQAATTPAPAQPFDPAAALREALGGEPAEPVTGLEEGAAPTSGLPVDPNAEIAPPAPPQSLADALAAQGQNGLEGAPTYVAPPVKPIPTVVDPTTGQTRLDLPEMRAPNAPGEASELPQPAQVPDSQMRLYTDEEMGARAPAAIAMRNSLRNVVGKSSSASAFIDKLHAVDMPELVKAVRDQAQVFVKTKDGAFPGWFQKLAQSLDVVDETGKARDVAAEYSDLMAQAADLRAKADAAYGARMTGKTMSELGADTPAGAKEAAAAKAAKDAQVAKATALEKQAASIKSSVDLHAAADNLPDRLVAPDTVKPEQRNLWMQGKLFAQFDDPKVKAYGDRAARLIEQHAPDVTIQKALSMAKDAMRVRTSEKKAQSPLLDEHLRAAEDTTQPQDLPEQPVVDRDAEARIASTPETPFEAEQASVSPGIHPVVEAKDMSPEAQMLIRDKLTPPAPVEPKQEAVKRSRRAPVIKAETEVTPDMERQAAQERTDYAAKTQDDRAFTRAAENAARLAKVNAPSPVAEAAKKATSAAPDVKPPKINNDPAGFMAWQARQKDILGRMAEPITRTPADAEMEGLISHGATVDQILGHLAQHGENPFVQQVAKMVRRLGLKTTIGFELHPETSAADRAALELNNADGSFGELHANYDQKVDHIQMISRNDMQANALHEIIHAATHQAIDAAHPVAAKLERMRAQLERTLKAKGMNTSQIYGLKDVHEFTAEAFSNKAFQKLLADQPSIRKWSMLDVFKDAISKMLNLPNRMRSMLDDVVQHGQTLMDDQARLGSVQDTHQRAQILAKRADGVLAEGQKWLRDEGLGKLNLTYKARGQMLGWNTLTHIRDAYGKIMPGLHSVVDGRHTRDVLNARISQKSLSARRMVDTAAAAVPEARGMISNLMTYTSHGVDPRRGWLEHTWLHEEKNNVFLHTMVDKANAEYRALVGEKNSPIRKAQAAEAYHALIASNKADELARISSLIHDYGSYEFADQHLPEFAQHPTEAYRLDQTGLHDSPEKSEAFWRNKIQRQLEALQTARTNLSAQLDGSGTAKDAKGKERLAQMQQAKAELDAQFKALGKDAPPEQRTSLKSARAALQKQIDGLSDTSRTSIERGLDSLDELVNDMNSRIETLDQAPYFHQGRYGKFFVSGHLILKDGQVQPEHVEAIQKAMDAAGFDKYALNQLGDKSSVFLRCETADQAAALQKIMQTAQEKGWLDADKPVKAGEPKTNEIVHSVAPAYLKRIMERVQQSSAFAGPENIDEATSAALSASRAQIMREMTAQYMDALPALSLKKVYQVRKNIQGFDKDMLRNFSHRAQVASNNLSNLAAAHKIDAAMAELNNNVDAAKESGDVNKALMTQQVLREVATREANRAWHLDTTMVDHIRAANHAFYLGASVSYMLEQLSQLPMLLLPELGKKHGFLASAKAIGSVTGQAFKIMRALAMSQHRWDAVLTPQVLENAGVGKDQIKMLMGVANRGGLDMNSFTREMGDAARGGKENVLTRTLQKANATAVYAEMLSRVISVLAADKLHTGVGAEHEAYVDHVLSQSMMDWGSWNTSRQTSKYGFAGKMTPLMMSFTGYQTRIIEKLVREVHDAIGGDAEAKKFLAGHLAAVTMISGTLGMPMASAFAGVASNLANFLTGRDDFDVETSYREFLSHMLGKDLGQVVAKGLPTAAGVDLSDLGDQNITPFSKLLSDRRKLEESMGDWAKGAMGSPFGIGLNWAEGMRDIAYGLPLQGMAKMVPHGLKGPMDAARMAMFGYEDNHGRKLPITASAQDILMRAVGLNPADKEEYDDKARKATAFKEMRAERAQFIRQRLELAYSHDDESGKQSAIQAAGAYGMDHVQHQLLPKLGSIVQQDRMRSATAGALGLPLGLSPLSDMETAKRLGSF